MRSEKQIEAAARAICAAKGLNPDCLHQINVFDGKDHFDSEDDRGRRYVIGWRLQEKFARAALEAALSAAEPVACEYEQDNGDGTYSPTYARWPLPPHIKPHGDMPVNLFYAAPPAPSVAVKAIELDGVSDAIAYGKGIWRTCTGCHESNEGYPTGPFSDTLKCHLGGGCFECGGIGAVWDTTDYEEMGNFIALSAQVQDAPLKPNVLPLAVTGQTEIEPGVTAADLGANAEPEDDGDACPACGGASRMGPFFPGGRSTICGNCTSPSPLSNVEGASDA